MMRFNWLVSILLIVFPGLAYTGEPVGKIAFLRGSVTVDGKTARDGAGVAIGQVVRTELGKCAILFRNEHVVHLDVDSELKITDSVMEQDSEKTELQLAYGKTRMLIKNTPSKTKIFNVRTRAAVMGVRGTHIYLNVPKDPLLPEKLMTVEGVAEVQRAEKRVTVRRNEIIETRAGGAVLAMEARRLPPREVMALADAIAPPPAPLRTGGEVSGFGGRQQVFDPNRRPEGMGLVPMMPLRPALDPIADGGAGVGLRVVLKPFPGGLK